MLFSSSHPQWDGYWLFQFTAPRLRCCVYSFSWSYGISCCSSAYFMCFLEHSCDFLMRLFAVTTEQQTVQSQTPHREGASLYLCVELFVTSFDPYYQDCCYSKKYRCFCYVISSLVTKLKYL